MQMRKLISHRCLLTPVVRHLQKVAIFLANCIVHARSLSLKALEYQLLQWRMWWRILVIPEIPPSKFVYVPRGSGRVLALS